MSIILEKCLQKRANLVEDLKHKKDVAEFNQGRVNSINYITANERNSDMRIVTASADCTDMLRKVPKMISVLDADIEYFNGNFLDYYYLIVFLKATLKI